MLKKAKLTSLLKSSRFLLIFGIAVLTFGLITTACGNKSNNKKNNSAPDSLLPDSAQMAVQSSTDTTITVDEFQRFALKGDSIQVVKAIEQGLNADTTGPDKRTALMMAAYNGHTGIVKYLHSKGADINAENTTGRTALMFAASGPFPEAVKFLIENGADIDAVDNKEHWTALMFAAAEGQKEVVQVLLDNGANTSLKDVDGETALDFAKDNNHTGIIKLMNSEE